MTDFAKLVTENSAFAGLWLSPDMTSHRNALFRSAILFLEGHGKYYKLRFNQGVEEECHTWEFLWDYWVTPTTLYMHPLTFLDDSRIQIPWRKDDDASLMLMLNRKWQRFHPATMEELFAVGIEKGVVKRVLAELRSEGLTYDLECRFPSFP
jgi:hypothetical protein